jgi:hypothetical protein
MNGAKRLRFRPYVGRAVDGTPVVQDLEDFNLFAASTYLKIQAMPAGRPINFQHAMELWAQEMASRVLEANPENPAWVILNMGLTGWIRSLGYKIIIQPHEIEYK